MYIRIFKTLAAVKDEALQNYALEKILPKENPSSSTQDRRKLSSLPESFQKQYTDLMLELTGVGRKEFELLIEFFKDDEKCHGHSLMSFIEREDFYFYEILEELRFPLRNSHQLGRVLYRNIGRRKPLSIIESSLDLLDYKIIREFSKVIDLHTGRKDDDDLR